TPTANGRAGANRSSLAKAHPRAAESRNTGSLFQNDSGPSVPESTVGDGLASRVANLAALLLVRAVPSEDGPDQFPVRAVPTASIKLFLFLRERFTSNCYEYPFTPFPGRGMPDWSRTQTMWLSSPECVVV